MDMAIGVRRAVMQDIKGLIAAHLLQLSIQVFRLPALQQLWLLLGQIGLHVEIGLGQIQGVPVIHGILLFPQD